jgi:hypothetical protein
MAFEVSYNLENEQQFWDGAWCSACDPTIARIWKLTRTTELEDIVSTRCQEDELIDNALRAYLSVTTTYKGSTSSSASQCTYKWVDPV